MGGYSGSASAPGLRGFGPQRGSGGRGGHGGKAASVARAEAGVEAFSHE